MSEGQISDVKEELKHHRGDIKELYVARDDHNGRLIGIEQAVLFFRETQDEMKRDISDLRADMRVTCREIQKSIDKFVDDVNGTPKQNKEHLEKQDQRIKKLEDRNIEEKAFIAGVSKTTVISWGIILFLLTCLLWFVKDKYFRSQDAQYQPERLPVSDERNSAR